MPMIDIADLGAQEPVPGWNGRFLPSERMTFVYDDISAGSSTPVRTNENRCGMSSTASSRSSSAVYEASRMAGASW
jgi:hypothetical protein